MYTLCFGICIHYVKITTIKLNDIFITSAVGVLCVWAHEYACACGRIFYTYSLSTFQVCNIVITVNG